MYLLLYRMSTIHKYEMDASQSLNRCSKLWLQVSKHFRRRTYAIFQQFTVHCTHVQCPLYVTRKHLTILISDFSLKIAPFFLRLLAFLVLSRWSSSIYLFEYLQKYYLIVVQLKSMGKRILIIIHLRPNFVFDGLGWQHIMSIISQWTNIKAIFWQIRSLGRSRKLNRLTFRDDLLSMYNNNNIYLSVQQSASSRYLRIK